MSTDKTLTPPPHTEPVVFTRDMLDWLPWLEPIAEAPPTTATEMTPAIRQYSMTVAPERFLRRRRTCWSVFMRDLLLTSR